MGGNRDVILKAAIQLPAQHLHRCGITRTRVPRARAEGFDTHQIVGQIGSFEAVPHCSLLEADVDGRRTWVDQDCGQGEFAPTAVGPADAAAVGRVVLVVNVKPKLTVEGVSGVGQWLVRFRGDA